MSGGSEWLRIEDLQSVQSLTLILRGDYSFKRRQRSGHTLAGNLAQVAQQVAAFIADLRR